MRGWYSHARPYSCFPNTPGSCTSIRSPAKLSVSHTYSAQMSRVNLYYLRRKRPRMRIARRPPLLVTSSYRLCSSMPRISCRLHGVTEITMMQPLSSLVLYRICRKTPKPCSGRLGMPA